MILAVLKAMHAQGMLSKASLQDFAGGGKAKPPKDQEALDGIERALEVPLKSLFRRSGLDIENDGHWNILLVFIAWAVYRKDPGHPKEWSRDRLRKLNIAVLEMRREHGGRSDLDCCTEIAKSGKFGDVAGATLRRKLSQARKIGSGNRKLRC